MGTPTKKRTSSSKKMHYAHQALKKTQINLCSKCKEPVRPHHACVNCGTYKGKVVVKIRASRTERDLAKTAKKKVVKKTKKQETK